jgi:iron complex transport system substrate-binding protein
MPDALRIVSLISSATEMLCALGWEDSLVAVSHECDYPPAVAGKPRITGSFVRSAASSGAIDEQVRELMASGYSLYGLDVEMLVALKPDLVITQAQCDVCAIRYADVVAAIAAQPLLSETQILALNPRSVDDVLEDMLRIGRATGSESAAQQVVAMLRARIDGVREKTADLPAARRPRIVCIEWTEPLMLAGNWTPQLVDWAGGINGLSVFGAHSIYNAWQEVVDFDPEVVVIMPCGFDLARSSAEAQVLPSLPQWSEVAAVRHGRVFVVDGNAYFNRSGPRLVESLEILAHLVQPEIFPRQGIAADIAAWQPLSW